MFFMPSRGVWRWVVRLVLLAAVVAALLTTSGCGPDTPGTATVSDVNAGTREAEAFRAKHEAE